MQSHFLHQHHQSPPHFLHLPSIPHRNHHRPNRHHLTLPSPSRPPLLHLRHSPSPLLVPLKSSPASNPDLAPVPVPDRTLTASDLASIWIGLVVGVPSYYLAGSLVDLGMSWWQGIATVVSANFITLIPLVLISVPAAKYGIPFPILARSSFGPNGSHLPSLLRSLVACGWFGIESWIGGQSLFLLLPSSLKSTITTGRGTPSLLEFACFILFWLAQLAVIMTGMQGIKQLEKYSAPILTILTASLFFWSYASAGGLSAMLSLTSRLSPSQFWAVFFPSLTANVAFWATLSLNIPDFTRYSRSQRDQILGQAGLPIFMGLFTFVGLAVTSSTKTIFGHVISDPIQLLGRIGGLPTRILAILGIALATITTNIAANVVAPANALVSLSPATFSFRKGTLVTALLAVAFQPWRLLGSSESFIYTWLVGYSALMGPIAGVILVDYYVVKGMELDVEDLYSESSEGRYYYSGGFNVAALVALFAGVAPLVPGFMKKVGVLSNTNELFVVAYNNAWFVGFFASGIVYCLLSKMQQHS